MQRIIVICEGETEQEFCSKTLQPYFQNLGIHIQNPLIKKSMGGIVGWSDLKKQIEMHLKSDRNAFVTLFIDYYGLNRGHQFPSWIEAEANPSVNNRIEILESGMFSSIESSVQNRFIPYIQLHEFEGLLFNDIQVFYEQISTEELVGLEELTNTFRDFKNPELINNGIETAPSKRLKRIVLGYNKIVYGNILAEAIGLSKIRAKSPRFNEWLNSLEQKAK